MLIIGCLTCHRPLGCHHDVEGSDEQPTAGDVLVCAYCRTINILDENLRPRAASSSEREEIEQELRDAGVDVSRLDGYGGHDHGR